MRARLLFLVLPLLSLLTFAGWSAPPQAAGVDPEIDAIVKAMCDHLTSLRAFTMETEDTLEEVFDSGQRIHFSHRKTAHVQRPGLLKVEGEGDLRNRTYWKKGRSLSVADHDHGVWAQVEVPESLDDATDHLATRFDMTLPLADLFSANPYAIFTARQRSGTYVGRHGVDGHACHHLAFTQAEVDWQIWIDAGETPVPRKLVITYKGEPGHPQHTVILRHIRPVETIPAAEFEFAPPAGYEQIEVFAPANGEEGEENEEDER